MNGVESACEVLNLVYEWFAGWRWELWRDGSLLDESLRSFEHQEDCAYDARLRHPAAGREALA